MSTRNRLTSAPSMPGHHKEEPKTCQAACGSTVGIGAQMASGRRGFPRVAAFRRRAVLGMLILAVRDLATPAANAASSDGISDGGRTADHVHVSARRAGDMLLIVLRIDPGYHVNANPASSEYLIPTSVAFARIVPQRVEYPPATPFKPAFSDKPINVYVGNVVIGASFLPGALDRTHVLRFTVTAQACTEQICLPPDDITDQAKW